jgi:hypothetical protein
MTTSSEQEPPEQKTLMMISPSRIMEINIMTNTQIRMTRQPIRVQRWFHFLWDKEVWS